ncbi:DUF4071 domain-containing protein [Tumebacillus sp. ITR2]|uniref:DUF4071 domain-containing protein n=2 Tax=Tumebacillus amylolyticus TaxID=2801339 RepID=A0ABS1J6M8_9BACL|nr:DUF4071 domain-containing protein [Tumebacillus amylolyticus]
MGYGEKVDYPTGRLLNMDATYFNVIKQAVEAAGLHCVRADELIHSGTIDVPMYEYLLKADVVIADLSTYNANALYELGVRHALKPHTTLLIAESKFQNPFDLGHTVIRRYEHLGKDIGYSEATRFQKELKEAIQEILKNPQIDSPVYTYLKDLKGFEESRVVQELPIPDGSDLQTLNKIVERGQKALDEGEFLRAKELFGMAGEMDPQNSFFVQRRVLATYKSKSPTAVEALREAWSMLEPLDVQRSADPETLGLAGAVQKRLWEELHEIGYLDRAIGYYERGFYIKRDYYNGINFAFLLNVRGRIVTGDDRIADQVLANRVRKQVVEICQELMRSDFDQRSDQYWILATLEEAYFGLQQEAEYLEAKQRAEQAANQAWERTSTEEQLEKLRALLEG